MKRFQTAILAAAVLTLAGLSSAQLTLYVNPTTGNDSWAGTISSPSGGNGPLKTPAGVQAAIVNHGPCNGPIVVNFEAGAYYLTSAWTIPAADTCTSNASSRASAPKLFTVGLDEIESARAPPMRESMATDRRCAFPT